MAYKRIYRNYLQKRRMVVVWDRELARKLRGEKFIVEPFPSVFWMQHRTTLDFTRVFRKFGAFQALVTSFEFSTPFRKPPEMVEALRCQLDASVNGYTLTVDICLNQNRVVVLHISVPLMYLSPISVDKTTWNIVVPDSVQEDAWMTWLYRHDIPVQFGIIASAIASDHLWDYTLRFSCKLKNKACA